MIHLQLIIIFSINIRYLIFVLAVLQFTQTYQGESIMSRVGSSVNFTWTFTGDPSTIDWGIRNRDGSNSFESNEPILSVDRVGSQTVLNQKYNGRINGIRSGNSQSGKVVFTLRNVTMKDMELYLCMLVAGFGDSSQYDDVKLVVKGNYG